MTLHNIAEYRKAQEYVKDLEKILKIVNAAEINLRNYEKYRPVQHILTTIMSEKPILDMFLEKSKIIVETKGERRK